MDCPTYERYEIKCSTNKTDLTVIEGPNFRTTSCDLLAIKLGQDITTIGVDIIEKY